MMPASSSAITAAYKTAWFMAHRIREGMRELNPKRPLGSRRRAASSSICRVALQLRAAEDRIAELEAELASYQERAERAEQWLHKVYTEIEDRFLRQDGRSRVTERAHAPSDRMRASR